MKIEHLIASLDEARAGGALSTRAASQAAGQTIGKNMAQGLPAADANAAITQAKTLNPTSPAAQQLSVQDRLQQYKANKAAATTTPATTAPANFGKGVAMPTNPVTVPGAGTSAVPPATTAPAATTPTTTTPPATTTPTTPATIQPTTTQPATTEPAEKKPGIDWKKGIQNVGDVASQVTGAIGQTVGAVGGGLGRGYHTARQGKKFGGLDAMTANNYAGDPYQQGGSGSNYTGAGGGGAASSGAAGDAEIAQLKSDIASITGRLDKAGIAEKKQR